MSALSMTLMGCKETTHAQLSTVLRYSHSNEQVMEAFSKVIQKYQVRFFIMRFTDLAH